MTDVVKEVVEERPEGKFLIELTKEKMVSDRGKEIPEVTFEVRKFEQTDDELIISRQNEDGKTIKYSYSPLNEVFKFLGLGEREQLNTFIFENVKMKLDKINIGEIKFYQDGLDKNYLLFFRDPGADQELYAIIIIEKTAIARFIQN